MDKAFAVEIVTEIGNLKKHPELPIQEVINLKAWRSGCLGVDLNTATDVRTHALARLCVDWCVGRYNAPRDNSWNKELD